MKTGQAAFAGSSFSGWLKSCHFISDRKCTCFGSTYTKIGKDEINDIVKLRQGSGKDRQGMALKAKGLKA